MKYKVFYRGKDAHYPAFETKEGALEFYLKCIEEETGESREDILAEDWPSPRGVEPCVEVQEVDDDEE